MALPSFPVPGGPVRRSGKGWVWFFVILALLTVTAIVINVRYNLSQQLTADHLAAARALWEQKGPRDYDLEYEQKGADPGVFVSHVRDGKVVSLTRNSQPLEPRLYKYYDMAALFAYIEQFMKIDAEPGKPRTFVRAQFDSEDGHLVHYRRSVMGTQEWVELNVQLDRVIQAPDSESAQRAPPTPPTTP
jgi:hypothetical protein